jgi:lipoate-protein ligase A
MLCKSVSFAEPEKNILYDEVLLDLAEHGKGGEVLRLWESPVTFVVLGRTGKEQEDIKIDAVLQDGIPVLRRASGGGTVLQGKGCLNYSLVRLKTPGSPLADLHRSYSHILGKVMDALKTLGVKTVFCPVSDIALAEDRKKISGNAQKRGRKFFLHHGTILYGFDLPKIERYLWIPRDVPEYRRGRSHLDFVANVSLAAADIQEALTKAFAAECRENGLNEDEKECLEAFVHDRNVFVELAG